MFSLADSFCFYLSFRIVSVLAIFSSQVSFISAMSFSDIRRRSIASSPVSVIVTESFRSRGLRSGIPSKPAVGAESATWVIKLQEWTQTDKQEEQSKPAGD